MKKTGYSFVLAGLALLLLTACEINKLNSAQDHYNNKRYAAAIQELDAYIGKAKNGALITRSEILRGKCYHELGLMARQRESWDLAVKFLKLSNSEEADQALADVYKTLCLKALEQKQPAVGTGLCQRGAQGDSGLSAHAGNALPPDRLYPGCLYRP